MSAPPAYVGISGIVSRTEVLAAISAFPGRQLMVGVLASDKTLAGQQDLWWRRYPKIASIAGIFSDDPRCLNLVHYGADTPPDGDTLARLFEMSGHRCHGFQFNAAWPNASDFWAFRRLYERTGREPRIVLQLGRGAGVAHIAPYASRGLITDVLIDASGGTGEPLDVEGAAEVFGALRAAYPHLGLGVAGGLCAETVPQVAPLLQRSASVDAGCGLRDGDDGGGRLDLARVKAYLEAVAKAVRPG
ncbi:hypothetical protein WMF37_01720 [Sorangium sp. So ce291]|uniref:hypothetical protein n=1 Tax=Sorangium sp. So ce291 TaxID=3133294 RepID=UPI003F632938